MKKKIPWFGATDIGRQRKSNQDCFVAVEDLGLWVLCDGDQLCNVSGNPLLVVKFT